MKEEFIFVNQVTGPLFIDIVNRFSAEGHKVTLYTGKVESISVDLDGKIRIRKLTPYNRKTVIRRITTWLFFFLQSWFFILIDKKQNTRIFLVSNPPVAPFLNLLFKNSSDILIYDIYPDALTSFSSVSEKSYIYKVFSNLNRCAFKKATTIFTISEGMKKILEQYTFPKKIKVVPCWADNDYIQPIERENNLFIKDHGLTEKFIVMYSGNLGLSHDIESILQSALLLKYRDDIQFIIIGDGAKKEFVKNYVERHSLKNVLVLPLQSPEMLKYSLASADIAVVTLDAGGASYAVPSKIYYFLAAGAVILAISDKGSELASIVNDNSLGRTINPHDVKNIVNCIQQFANNDKLLNETKIRSRLTSFMYSSKNANLFIENY